MPITGIDNTVIVWSENAGEYAITGLPSSVTSATVAVLLNDTQFASFTLIPANGEVSIPLRDLLRSVLPEDPGVNFTEENYQVQQKVTINVTVGGTAYLLSFRAMRGGVDSGKAVSVPSDHWLTFKPQTTTTFPWAKEYLALHLDYGYHYVPVLAKLYWANNGSEVVPLVNVESDVIPEVHVIDCSYENVVSKSQIENDTLIAYDVYSSSGIKRHRFLVGDGNRFAREFIYINSLGVPDTVFSTGKVRHDMELSSAVARIEYKDVGLSSDVNTMVTAHSGPIATRREAEQWDEFLRSGSKWVLVPGDVIRDIIVEEQSSEMVERELSDVAITYHLADVFDGRYYDDSELDDYDYLPE